MASNINQIAKQEYSAVRIDYTDKDYVNILNDLIESIPGITQKWNSTDANDPGMILVKLMAILGDMLFYTQDMQALEVYPSSVTLRRNASVIYKLIGYKMKWYRSATVEANVTNTYTSDATIPRFCTFTTKNKEITYTTFEQYELASNTSNNGFVTSIELIQGTPVIPTRISTNPYPETGKPWHSIYGYNYTSDDIVNNRLYLNDVNIDQDHIILVDNQNEVWGFKENIYLTTDVGKFFEFGVDDSDNPYLELVDYWQNLGVDKFKVFYIRSDGESGEVYANTLTEVSGNVWCRIAATNTVQNVASFIKFTHFDSSYGYDPETPDEARKNSVKYLNTLDTIITLADFERATLREPGVANVRATDLTNDPGVPKTYYVGDINLDGTIDKLDLAMLDEYLADPENYKFPIDHNLQFRLADANGDGVVDDQDRIAMEAFLNPTEDMQDLFTSSGIGIKEITVTEYLNGFEVKLYILRTDEYEGFDDNSYKTMIITDLQQYKILPLTISVDLESINKYYWTVTGTFFTKVPLTRDDLQTIIVNINNELRYVYSPDKMNFNAVINYKEVIETILSVDDRILMVDLDPIEYRDDENKLVPKEQLTGDYEQTYILNQNLGDINQDGVVNYMDATLLRNYLDNPIVNALTSYQLKIADLNRDGVVNYKDYAILCYLAGVVNKDRLNAYITNPTLNPLTEEELDIYDMNRDGVVDNSDLTIYTEAESYEHDTDTVEAHIKLANAPILPGSVMIRLNNGEFTLRDNNNGVITNAQNALSENGSIDYKTGEIDLSFATSVYEDIVINYTHNSTNIATYRNLSTQTFFFDSTALKEDNVEDLL